jgi:hypothetical protein
MAIASGGSPVKRSSMWYSKVLGLIALVGTMTAWAQSPTLIQFEMTDQFGRVYRNADYEGRVLYVIGSDAKGSKFSESWSKAIYDALKEEAGIENLAALPLANLKGVPFFLRGTIKKKFPQEQDTWVLMDWKGQFAKAYDFEPRSTNILIFAPDGTLIHQAHGQEIEQDALDGIVEKLRDLLAVDS